jgi:hypothetical protein
MIEELALSLYNIQKLCGQTVTLLPSPLDGSGVFSWGRKAELNFSRIVGDYIPGDDIPHEAPGTAQHNVFNVSTNSNASANSSSSSDSSSPTGDVFGAAATPLQLPHSWPPSDGYWLVQCPVQFQGTPMLDLGFVRGMFRLQHPSGNGSSNSSISAVPGIPRNAGLGVSSRRPLMQFASMNMRGLPQGGMSNDAGNSSSSRASSRGSGQGWQAAASVGGSSWVSASPAEAYTHLLWFITR